MAIHKYHCNERFFQTIDNEAKAYWLGFIAADGCVTRGRLVIALSSVDHAHLKKFKTDIESTSPVLKSEKKRDSAAKNNPHSYIQKVSRIAISSRPMCDDLSRLGIVERKSKTLQFPTSDQVPNDLLRHFLRGYFDGDGSIYSLNDGRWGFEIIATIQFCGEFRKSLMALGTPKLFGRKHHTTRELVIVGTTCQRSLLLIRDYLYNGSTVSLDRKRKRFESMPDFEPKQTHLCADWLVNTMRGGDGFITRLGALSINRGKEFGVNIVRTALRYLLREGLIRSSKTNTKAFLYSLI
jgi:hypothetical protein